MKDSICEIPLTEGSKMKELRLFRHVQSPSVTTMLSYGLLDISKQKLFRSSGLPGQYQTVSYHYSLVFCPFSSDCTRLLLSSVFTSILLKKLK